MLKKIPGVQSSKSEIFPEYGSTKDGFPAWLSGKDRRLLQASASQIHYNLTVAKDGSGDFTTIGEAIAAAPNSSTTRSALLIFLASSPVLLHIYYWMDHYLSLKYLKSMLDEATMK